MKILLVGGPVEKHEMEAISKGLDETGYDVVIHEFESVKGTTHDPDDLLKKIDSEKVDIVLTRKNFYPGAGSNLIKEIGTSYIPRHLLRLGIPVVGCDSKTIGLLRDKAECDTALGEAGLPYTNDFILVDPRPGKRAYGQIVSWKGFEKDNLDNPFKRHNTLFIKPNYLGRSAGISDANVVHNLDELVSRIKEIKEEVGNQLIIINPFYEGREFTVGMIGNEEKVVLPVEVCQVEGYSENGIIPKDVKRGGIPSGRVYIQPIEDPELVKKLAEAGASISDVLGITDYTRVDFRESSDGNLHAIDINGVPGIKHMESYISMAAEEAYRGQENGFSTYGRLVSSIVSAGINRFGLNDEEHPTLFGLKNNLFEGD